VASRTSIQAGVTFDTTQSLWLLEATQERGISPVLLAGALLLSAVLLLFALRKPARTRESKGDLEERASPTHAREETKSVPDKPTATPALVAREKGAFEKGLRASKKGFFANLSSLLSGKKIDPALIESLEELMLTSDIGPKTSARLLQEVTRKLARKELADEAAVLAAIQEEARVILREAEKDDGTGSSSEAHTPRVYLMVGVNGVGKTTTIGKLATDFRARSKRVLLGAGDTFRAAAGAQLEIWAKRTDALIVLGKEGADPASVAYEATTEAIKEKVDVVLLDTAGRLHTKAPLMDEIRKVRKSVAKAMPGAPHETWLVLDATTGQNGVNQARIFLEAVEVTGIVLTKLDGTAKGGIVLAIADELSIPIRYVGLGEGANDLRPFDPDAFVAALFSPADDEA
jgi:fused signal recognition particle receptor